MNKKISLGLSLSIVAVAVAVTFMLTSSFSLKIFNDNIENLEERATSYEKLDSISSIVLKNYLGDIDEDLLADALANGYISTLNDKYADYLSPEEYALKLEEDNGSLFGIGILPAKDSSGYILIDNVIENSPAKAMGITAGSLIVEVNGESVLTTGYDKAVKNISGDVGTNVKLTIRKDGEDSSVTVTRSKIDLSSVAFRMIDDIAYIKISSFNNQTENQFIAAIGSANDAGAKSIIFDVRNNPGGSVNATIACLDYILPEGIIATATYKNGETKTLGESDSKAVDLPFSILINKNTASAAEMFAAAISDFGKGSIIGETSYGKGIMQTTFPLKDGSAVTFTTAKFQTTVTPNFDGVGIKPTYEVYMEHSSDADLAVLDESTDLHLNKAIEVLSANSN